MYIILPFDTSQKIPWWYFLCIYEFVISSVWSQFWPSLKVLHCIVIVFIPMCFGEKKVFTQSFLVKKDSFIYWITSGSGYKLSNQHPLTKQFWRYLCNEFSFFAGEKRWKGSAFEKLNINIQSFLLHTSVIQQNNSYWPSNHKSSFYYFEKLILLFYFVH